MNRSQEIEVKTERLIKMLDSEKLGGVLLNSQPNFAWLTAGGSNGIDSSRENGAASLLVRKDGKRFVLASRIEMPRILAEEVSAEDFEPIEFAWEAEKASSAFLAERAQALLNQGDALGADVSFGANAKTIESVIARCRYQLTSNEIERYKALGHDAGLVIGRLARTLKPGQTEIEIASFASYLLAQKNIRPVVMLVAADERLEKFRHPIPTEKKWEKTVMIVVCARRGGLIVSLSRIVSAGNISPELRWKTLVSAKVSAQLQAATTPDKTGAEFYQTAAAVYEKEGFAGEINLHHQGGAIGYRTRDWVVHPASAERVQLNQAFAWNPSISGTKVEETCLLTNNGIETITKSPDWAQIPVVIDGREYLSPDILCL